MGNARSLLIATVLICASAPIDAAPVGYVIASTFVDRATSTNTVTFFSPLSGAHSVQHGSNQATTKFEFNYDASAFATIGLLRGSSSATIECNYPNAAMCFGDVAPGTAFYSVRTQSSFGDRVTIDWPGHNGTQGYLRIFFDVDGYTSVYQNTGTAVSAYGQMSLCNGYCGPNNWVSNTFFTDSPGRLLVGVLPITFGAPAEYGVNLFTGSNIAMVDWRMHAASASAQYGHTARFAGVQVCDGAGASVTDVSLQADSGYEYALVATPEPSAAVLAGCGFALLVLVRRVRSPREYAHTPGISTDEEK